MKPSIAASRLQDVVVEYLSSTYGLADVPAATSLKDFFSDPETGLFKGPYLRVRAPFRPAEPGWERELEWCPRGFRPYRHQARAWTRLSSLRSRPEPTVIATGTGSGKTESFLVPILDHCRRNAGKPGVKAVLLYPMNALASDQAARLDDELTHELRDEFAAEQAHQIDDRLAADPTLAGVSAGLYIGGTPRTAYRRVLTHREDIQAAPPDILITNYMMLDRLLHRPKDLVLWEGGSLAYIVVDEFHTYDGAQGTDVAMLLRRLKAASGADPVPVATSATLASGADAEQAITAIAAKVFGAEFGPGSVVGEDRLTAGEFVSIDYDLPEPTPAELAALSDPYESADAMRALAKAVLDRDDPTPAEAGRLLRRHVLTQALLDGFASGELIDADAFFRGLTSGLMYSWRRAWNRDDADQVAEALHRLLALLSWARDPERPNRPLLHVEAHFWIRAVSRLLRAVPVRDKDRALPAERIDDPPRFSWVEDADPEADWLPSIYCRHCGRSGWMALNIETDHAQLVAEPAKVYEAAVRRSPRQRAMIAARAAECEAFRDGATAEDNLPLALLVPGGLNEYASTATEGVPVLVELAGDKAAQDQRCPACGADNAIRFVGTGLPTLASVTVTELFKNSLREDEGDEAKTLLFSDSVQDAAHRAGFLSARSHNFTLRAHLAHLLADAGPLPLNELVERAITAARDDASLLPAVIPTDLHKHPKVEEMLHAHSDGDTEAWELIAERVAFAAMMEFGLRAQTGGRTLESTGTAVATVDIGDEQRLGSILVDVLTASRAQDALHSEPDPNTLVWHAKGVIDRLRNRGGIFHRWLRSWVDSAGTHDWRIRGGRPLGIPAFPPGVSRPVFFTDRNPKRSDFDPLDAERGTWLQDWTAKTLRLDAASARRYLPRLAAALAGEGLLACVSATDASADVYGLTAGHLRVRLLSEADADRSQVECARCASRLTVDPDQRGDWLGTPCRRWRCGGSYVEADWYGHYYHRLYTTGRVLRVVAAEHTGVLDREIREDVERHFRHPSSPDSPNVISSTPTMELGIDIGDLSAVVLAGAPRSPASYTQRSGRAGRATGNALTVVFANRRPRDLAYFQDPSMLLNGEIRPPGAHLAAAALLHRQYFAYLLDQAARGRLGEVEPLPRLAKRLFGTGGWLQTLQHRAVLDARVLVGDFLDLFGPELDEEDPEARRELTAWADGGIERDLKTLEARWERRQQDLIARKRELERHRRELAESAMDTADEERAIEAEIKGIVSRLRELRTKKPAHDLLVEYGVLPNYSLLSAPVAIEATVTTRSETAAARAYTTTVREYERPASRAIRELAPGNVFHANGYAHQVRGLDIGPSGTRIEKWRTCPACGFVRKGQAAHLSADCDRCGAAMGDTGNEYQVLVPERAYSYDRAEDVRIDDGKDDRDEQHYTVVQAVDADPGDVKKSWRHAKAPFGFDYCKRAFVRQFNLGPSKHDPHNEREFAGATVTYNPFWACPACGGTAVNDNPDGKFNTRVLAADKDRRHHRPWCANRETNTDHKALILAEELETEIVRLMLPLISADDPGPALSFQAALQIGIAEVYRGDPDHIGTLIAHMPVTDAPDEIERPVRVVAVLYDRLSGGTGYLRSLCEDEKMRDVLTAARDRLADCACEARHACHRCLLAYTREANYPHVSRAEALRLLDRVLSDWEVEPNSGIEDISTLSMAESELEKQFIAKLERWAAADEDVSLTKSAKYERTLVLRTPDGQTVRWRVKFQHTIAGTRPDAYFLKLDGEPVEVALYLDGFSFHAHAGFNRRRLAEGKPTRLRDDAQKRQRLREGGAYVFAASWSDVAAWLESGVDADWLPVPHRIRAGLERLPGARPGDLAKTCFTNPVVTLTRFLAEPDPAAWRHRAKALVVGAVKHGKDREVTISGLPETAAVLRAAVKDLPLPAPGNGPVKLYRMRDDYGAKVIAAVQPAADAVTAGTVLDDRLEALEADEHQPRWRSWLYWSNLLQFLGEASFQMTSTGVDDIDPARSLPENRIDHVSHEGSGIDVDPSWEHADLELIDDQASRDVALKLKELGVAAPEIGEEHVEGIPAELAWPASRVAVVAGEGDAAEDHVRRYRGAGWWATTAVGCDITEVAEQIAAQGGQR
jgi:rubrerythrin